MIAASLLCAVSCTLLVLAEWRTLPWVRVATKLAASAGFVVVGAQGLHPTDPGLVSFARWILAGLAFGALGDAALLGHGTRWFLVGLAAFLAGHLAYVVGIAIIEPPSAWPADAGVFAALPIAAGAIALALLWPRLGSMRGPVVGYVLAIVAMVVAAIAATRGAALPSPQRVRLLAGASLFFVSDLAVARDRFVARTLANKLWGLPAYFAGQLLIAWSLDDL